MGPESVQQEFGHSAPPWLHKIMAGQRTGWKPSQSSRVERRSAYGSHLWVSTSGETQLRYLHDVHLDGWLAS